MSEELQKKVDSALKNDIICEVVFTDEEIDELKNFITNAADKLEERASKYFYSNEIKVLIVLIVYYAQSWGDGDENRFWIRILGNIFERTTFSPNNKFYDEVEKVLNQYNKKIFISPAGKRMLRETLLFHSYAPKVSISSFIKLLFNCCIDEDFINRSYMNDKDIYEKMAKSLSKRFSKSSTSDMDNDIEFDGNSYSVRSGIKYACIQEQALITNLIEKIMTNFDELLFEKQDIENTIIGRHVASTINTYLSQNTNIKNKKTLQKTDPIVSDFSKINAYYLIIDESPVLSLPEILVFDEELTDGNVNLYYDDKLVEKKDFEIIGHGFKRKIKKIYFDILKFNSLFVDKIKFRITLCVNGNLIYDSKETAYRKFILLNENIEIKKDCKPGCYYLVYPQNLKITECTDTEIQGLKKCFASVTASENQSINYKDKIIFFNNKKQNSHLIISGEELTEAQISVGETNYRIFNKVEKISIVLHDYFPENILYKINNNFPKSLMSNDVIKNDNQYTIYFDKSFNKKLNQIYFYDLKTGKVIEKLDFAIFDTLKIRFDKKYYFANQVGTLFVYDNGSEILFNKINANVDEIKFNYNDIGQITILCPNIKFCINDDQWNWSCPLKSIWHKSLHSGSVIKIINNSGLKIKILNNNSELKQISDDVFLLGDIIASNNTNDQCISLKIEDTLYNLFTIAYKEQIIGTPEFVYDDGSIIHDLETKFIGDDSSILLLELINEDEIKTEFKFGIHNIIETNNFAEGYYCYNIYLVHEGLYEDTKILIYSYNDYMIALGNVSKLEYKNSYIKILNTKTPSKKIKFDNCYIDNIEYKEENFYPVYTGILHCNKIKTNIEFERKDENALKIYYQDYEEVKLINVNIDNNTLTTQAINNKNIFECFSFYYKKETI